MKKIRVGIVDDHLVVVKGISQILTEKDNNIEVIFGAIGVDSMLEKINAGLVPDIILMDLSMPGKSGLDGIRVLKEQYKDIKVIIVSMHPEEQYGTRCIKAGAWLYMEKEVLWDELVRAVHIIYKAREPLFSPIVEDVLKRIDYLPLDPRM